MGREEERAAPARMDWERRGCRGWKETRETSVIRGWDWPQVRGRVGELAVTKELSNQETISNNDFWRPRGFRLALLGGPRLTHWSYEGWVSFTLGEICSQFFPPLYYIIDCVTSFRLYIILQIVLRYEALSRSAFLQAGEPAARVAEAATSRGVLLLSDDRGGAAGEVRSPMMPSPRRRERQAATRTGERGQRDSRAIGCFASH
jgi:hypothetical protein